MTSWIRTAPKSIILSILAACTVGAVATLGGFIALTLTGHATDDYLAFVLMLVNVATLTVGGTVTAARSTSPKE